MSITSSALIDFAKQIQQIDDPEARAAIYESVGIDTYGFTKYPEDCSDAIRTIKTVGMQVKLLLDARKNLPSKKEEHEEIATLPDRGINDENNLTSKAVRFVSNNSGQITASVSSIGLGILGALYAGAPYPVRVGAIGGGLAFVGAKYILERRRESTNPDPYILHKEEKPTGKRGKEEIDPPKTAADLKAETSTPTTHRRAPVLDNKNAPSAAIALAALSSLLQNPEDKNVTNWLSTGDDLYDEAIGRLELEKDQILDIEDIEKLGLLHPETILDPKVLKPDNDLNILRNEDDLAELINELKNLTTDKPIGVIISRPPGTYAIFFDPKSGYFFFDPHGSKGANYKPRNFKSPKFLIEHLMDLKPIDKESLELPEFYETEIGMNQNPNACEIRILRKKEDVLKEDEIESKEKEASSPAKIDLSEEERLEQAEKAALEHALRLSTGSLPSSSSDAPTGMEEEDFSSSSSSSTPCSETYSLFDDERLARYLQFEEDAAKPISSRSSQIAPSFEEDSLSEDELMRRATEESLAYSSDEEKIEDFIRYHDDNCLIKGESLNKYAAMIAVLSTPTAQDETLPLINDLNELLDSFGIKCTVELFGDILDLRDQKDITRKFETFKKLIQKGPELEKDRHLRFQEYVDDYFRRMRLYKRYNFFEQ
ncbi:MAG: hypothetical protein K940chlam5_00324 [Candidatus Anoxychlamydiales bacterium]|nr:hypothetical protein [Candidatus Anoxychlamydiales bacterium]